MPAGVHRTPADGMTILGLPGKIGNANTNLHRNVEVFLFVEQQPPLCYNLFYNLNLSNSYAPHQSLPLHKGALGAVSAS